MKTCCENFFRSLCACGTFWRCLAIAAAVIVLIVTGVCTGQTVATINQTDNIFIRFASTLILGVLVWIMGKWMWGTHKAQTTSQWWDLGGIPDEPTWDDVRRMAMGHRNDDPVRFTARKLRARFLPATLHLFVGYLILGCLAVLGLSIIAEDHVLPFLLTNYADASSSVSEAGAIMNLSANLTAFLALIAAAISIYFTHRQLQAKVKADSRQAWIDKLRAQIACTIALADAVRYRTNNDGIDKIRRELIAARLETELMLNPSEKDHRLLMYLIQKLAFFGKDKSRMDANDPKIFEGIDDVINIRCAIRKSPDYSEKCWKDILMAIPAISDNTRGKAYSDLVGYAMRLAHIVLKREWERVKATR